MKALLWLALPLIFLALSFAISKRESEPTPGAPKLLETKKEESITLSISPATVLQGEPALITIRGPLSPGAIPALTLDGQPLVVFEHQGIWSALVGIDLHREPGTYPLTLTLDDGQIITEKLEVKQRVMEIAEFDIPESFGGNTPEGQQELTSNLEKDTATYNEITKRVTPKQLWNGAFRYPLDGEPIVTDTYGYSRQTGAVNLSHNGTDFRAAEGTPVYAMNAGMVVFNGRFQNYGNTVILDHGLGIMTIYMHLSEVTVDLNKRVEKGDLIAKSGNTGYSLAPHLHLSVRIGGYSIDPMKFLELMGPR